MTSLPALRRDVTVLIPAFNRFDLLRAVLEGFAKQTARDAFELIVVDDHSKEPLEEFVRQLNLPATFHVIRREWNGGRGAALNTGLRAIDGGVVIICDSDIVPSPDMVADHMRFHGGSNNDKSTCLGSLEWGMQVELFGLMMGARSNPRMIRHRKALGWSEWYTDNWSCRRSLLNEPNFFFDETFRAWGYEDLDFGLRLERSGATNQLIDGAHGYHLKAPSPESLMTNFSNGAPNLLRMASKYPDEPMLQQWLGFRVTNPLALECGGDIFRIAWGAIQRRDQQIDAFTDQIAEAVADCVFRYGTASGLQSSADSLSLPSADDTEFVLGAASLVALLAQREIELGNPRGAQVLLSQCADRIGRQWREAWDGRVDFYRAKLQSNN